MIIVNVHGSTTLEGNDTFKAPVSLKGEYFDQKEVILPSINLKSFRSTQEVISSDYITLASR